MKALVIGYGSIGKRHAANLTKLGHEVVLIRHSRETKPNGQFREYYDLEEGLDEEKPELAVIASPTACHAADARQLLERGVPFLLEKPPTMDFQSTVELRDAITAKSFGKYDIAFNLRFYPPLRFIKEYLPRLGKVYSMRVAAGSYLPAWRPDVDYRKSSSARSELGGGVHIELVHELDYVLWFLGMPSRVAAHVARVGNLEISTEDMCVALLIYSDGAAVELHLDYLSHKSLRGCQIIAERGTLEWSFKEGNVIVFEPGGAKPRELFSLGLDYDLNQTYMDELKNFIGLVRGTSARLINIAHGVNIMRILKAMIEASASRQWVDVSEMTQTQALA